MELLRKREILLAWLVVLETKKGMFNAVKKISIEEAHMSV